MADVYIDEAALDAWVNDPDGPVARDLERRAIAVQTVATRLAPVDTGRLQASITYEVVVSGAGLEALVGTNVEYAIYVEMGTFAARAQPFLRPALAAA